MSAERVPADLRPPEWRAARIAELRGEITREWVRYALVDGALVSGPFAVFLVLWALDAVPDGWLVPAIVAAVAAAGALVLWTLLRRVRPRQRELAELERLAG